MYTPVILSLLLLLALVSSASNAAEQRQLKVYNWADYMDKRVLRKFEQETGIDVVYDTYASSAEVEAAIVAGGQGYDIVVPSLDFMAKQIRYGFFKRLDQSLLTNYGNLDRLILRKAAKMDIQNAHGVPYMWGTTGIGYNLDLVAEVLGDDAPTDSWDLLFKPKNLAKLAQCGVSVIDEPTELYAIALNYLGKNPNSTATSDYRQATEQLLAGLTKHINYFDSTDYAERLANGEICVALGWSEDIYQAMAHAKAGRPGVTISYSIPKEGTVQRVDMLAIPELAENVSEAHEFINFLMRPDVAAANTNYLANPNAIPSSRYMIDEAITQNQAIYPSQAVQAKLFTNNPRKTRLRQAIEDEWTVLIGNHKSAVADR
ncbi:extracellular solute-binding protein [Halioxenophilus aromaticivorans]|uniref:Putrescine-binding periplasmic protein n=1 Tax=Halioxenophilus aromaticivorans TaxID=1306992 RepID=A0AAV3U3V8_9ALTE